MNKVIDIADVHKYADHVQHLSSLLKAVTEQLSEQMEENKRLKARLEEQVTVGELTANGK